MRSRNHWLASIESERNIEGSAKHSSEKEDRNAAPKICSRVALPSLALMVGRHFQPQGEKRCQAERQRNSTNTGRPTDPVEYLTKDCGSDQTAGEVASEIDATRGTAIYGGGLAHKTSRSRLGEKGPNADEHHAEQDQGEIGQQKQRQAHNR